MQWLGVCITTEPYAMIAPLQKRGRIVDLVYCGLVCALPWNPMQSLCHTGIVRSLLYKRGAVMWIFEYCGLLCASSWDPMQSRCHTGIVRSLLYKKGAVMWIFEYCGFVCALPWNPMRSLSYWHHKMALLQRGEVMRTLKYCLPMHKIKTNWAKTIALKYWHFAPTVLGCLPGLSNGCLAPCHQQGIQWMHHLHSYAHLQIIIDSNIFCSSMKGNAIKLLPILLRQSGQLGMDTGNKRQFLDGDTPTICPFVLYLVS